MGHEYEQSLTHWSCSEFLPWLQQATSSNCKAQLGVDLPLSSLCCLVYSISYWLCLEATSFPYYVSHSVQGRRLQGSMLNQSKGEIKTRMHKQGRNSSLKAPPQK